MGSGKSTLGRALGAMTSLRFVDLDTLIEARCHRTINTIFKEDGEEHFRRIERRLLEEVCNGEDIVVACGGGAPSYADNMELMNSRGLTVYLNTSRDLLLRRLKAGRRSRPLLSGLDDSSLETFVDRLFAEREPYYSEAKATFSGDLLETLEQIELSANRFIESFHIN